MKKLNLNKPSSLKYLTCLGLIICLSIIAASCGQATTTSTLPSKVSTDLS